MHAFFLVGPTAVGKSSAAQFAAQALGYDILSADSMLVYKGMDIGTAKPSIDERSRVRYYGIDITSPDTLFSVGDYYSYAYDALTEADKNNRKVIVVGGTGLYVKSLTHGLASLPPCAVEIRAYWTRVFETQGLEALQHALLERSPGIYASLKDRMNSRRLIRALEMVEAGLDIMPDTWRESGAHSGKGGRGSSESGDRGSGSKGNIIGLTVPADRLSLRIKARVEKMFHCGFIEEVKDLLKRYKCLSETARQAIGYAEAIDCLGGKCSLQEAMERTIMRTRQLAKKQYTWFRHQAYVEWIHVDADMDAEDISGLVVDCWREYGPTNVMVKT